MQDEDEIEETEVAVEEPPKKAKRKKPVKKAPPPPEPESRAENTETVTRAELVARGVSEPKTLEVWATYGAYKIVLQPEMKSLREGRDLRLDRVVSQRNVTIPFKNHRTKISLSHAKVLLMQQQHQYGADFIMVDDPKVSKAQLETETGEEIQVWDEEKSHGLRAMAKGPKSLRRQADAFLHQMYRRDVLSNAQNKVTASDLMHELLNQDDEDDE